MPGARESVYFIFSSFNGCDDDDDDDYYIH